MNPLLSGAGGLTVRLVRWQGKGYMKQKQIWTDEHELDV